MEMKKSIRVTTLHFWSLGSNDDRRPTCFVSKSPNLLWQFILMHFVLRGKKVVHKTFNTFQMFRDKILLGFSCERDSPKA